MAGMRYLKANRRNSQPAILYVLDTETKPERIPDHARVSRHVLVVGVARRLTWLDGRERSCSELVFTESMEFWEWFYHGLRDRRPAWVFAHNFAYDWAILNGFEECQAGRLRDQWQYPAWFDRNRGVWVKPKPWQGWYCQDGRPWMLFLCHEGRRANFVDTCNYWAGPLGDLAISSLADNPGIVRPMAQPTDPLTKCKGDVDTLQAAVTAMMTAWHAEDCGVWQPTAARLAMTSYRHKFLNSPILFHDNADALTLERKCYYGGRVECYFCGSVGNEEQSARETAVAEPPGPGPSHRTGLFHLDVNSLYPYVMHGGRFPCKLVCHTFGPSVERLGRILGSHGVVARVTIRAYADNFPVRGERGVSYPEGRFETCLAGPELAGAWHAGLIDKVHELAVYDLADLFSGFVDFWYQRKQAGRAEGDHGKEALAKLILNSLSAKWAQQNPAWKSIPGVDPDVAYGTWYAPACDGSGPTVYRSSGSLVEMKSASKPGQYYFPAIAAYITSYARLRMLDLMKIAGPRQVFHIATDALIVTRQGFEHLEAAGEVSPDLLGKLRLCGSYHSAEFRGPNNYRLGDRWCVSGVGPKGVQVEPGVWEVDRAESALSLIGRRPDGAVKWSRHRVPRPAMTYPRVVGLDGWTEPALTLD